VAENIAFGLETHRVPRAEIGRRVKAILELIGLSTLGKRMPTQISGGQQQRVALARSLVLEPPLLLLDEPLSSLDLKLRVQMREELKQLQQRLRKTTIFVTHDQTEALALSDRIAVLSEGRIEQIGTPHEIYSAPASRFVADFIGNSNLVDARVLGFADGIAEIVTTAGLRIKVRCGAPPPAQDVTALIRPECVRLDGIDGLEVDNTFSAVVKDVTYLGPDTQYRLVVEQMEPLLVVARTGEGATPILAQGRVHVRIEASDVVLLKR
jgi:ABC-type Fe3+/spermidine/putrescine transport system ATPase subunit